MGGFDSFSLQIARDNLVWVLYLGCLKLVLCPECLDLKLFWVRPKYFFFTLVLGPCDWVNYLIIKLSQIADVLSEASVTILLNAFSTISSLLTITAFKLEFLLWVKDLSVMTF